MNKKPKTKTIGERIREVFDKSGLTISEFAELLHCERPNVHDIFRRKKIDVELLIEISKALKHNFIAEICEKHNFSHNISSEVSFILKINMDDKALKNFVKRIKQLGINTIQ